MNAEHVQILVRHFHHQLALLKVPLYRVDIGRTGKGVEVGFEIPELVVTRDGLSRFIVKILNHLVLETSPQIVE